MADCKSNCACAVALLCFAAHRDASPVRWSRRSCAACCTACALARLASAASCCAGGAEHAIIGFFNLIDDAAMRVVEAEVRREQLRGSRTRCARIGRSRGWRSQDQPPDRRWNGLPDGIGVEKDGEAIHLPVGNRPDDRIPLALRDAECSGLRFGPLPGETGFPDCAARRDRPARGASRPWRSQS